MPGLGDEFRAAREARHLSLSDVSEQLHIRSLYLQSIEQEEWSTIGAPVYVRGFIRAYARFLGLDPERAIGEFNATRPAPDPAVRYTGTPSANPASLRAPAAAGAAKRPSPWLMLAALVAVALVAFVGYNYFEFQANNPPVPAAGASATASAAVAAEAQRDEASPAAEASSAAGEAPGPGAPAAVAKPSPKPTLAPSRTIELRLTARSWLRVDVDGAKALEGIFPAGTRRDFHGRSVYLRAGNAGAVVVVVNGKDEGTMGPMGDVVERTFTLAQE